MVAARTTVIALSKENRPIVCLRRGRLNAPLRVLILAGQHGDDRSARRALQSLLARPPQEVADCLPAIKLAVIPEANPDGCAIRTRCNADGIDLNQDHELLLSSETTAVHRFVRRWRPHVILDLHNYPSCRRHRHQVARNRLMDHDVFLDVPTHPAILARPGSVDATGVLRALLGAIADRDIRAGRCTIVGALDLARHSTPDVVDALNGLALRYGAFTILVENRRARPEETAIGRRRLRAAQERALWAVLEWLDQNHRLFASGMARQPAAPGTLVPLHFKYTAAEPGLRLVCRDAQQERPAWMAFLRDSASLAIRRQVPLPVGYAVPRSLEALLGVLRRHGFVSRPSRSGELCPVEWLRIEQGWTAREVVLAAHRMCFELERYEVFLTRQSGGDALAVLLEPESEHGLHRFAAMQIPLLASSWYPVLRVLAGKRLA